MRAPAAKLLERQIQKQVKDYLRFRGWRPVRTHFAYAPGTFSSGEPGMPDYLFLRYLDDGRALALWIEFKTPQDRRRCTCQPGESKPCPVCRQKAWHARERARGASVWVVYDLDAFVLEYESRYGWLHTGDEAMGQLDLLAGA